MIASVQLPTNITGYQIIEQLYAGSRTLVYRGIRVCDRQPVVLKILRHEYPNFNELVQFRHQYIIAKNLDIPGIIQTYNLEPYGNRYVLVTEDFGGISLQQFIQQHPLDIKTFLKIAIQLADILHELYQHRVIHKDIKPANILIHPETQHVKLIDFSISSLLPKETQEIQNPNILEGTLAYLSPEQTGRMNRGIDYRTDFYSLGVTFYELLTGQLPFKSDDPMELVHCHIAKVPAELGNRQLAYVFQTGYAYGNREEIPQVISNIVLKLMAKNAEDRYQSALGLKYDLEQCLTEWKETGKISEFIIAQNDRSNRFIIPEKLYGRGAEVNALLDAFDRVSGQTLEKQNEGQITTDKQQSEMMLVAGFSGIGKTAVINEVHKPIVEQQGYFIKGKFDQFNRNIPFSAFVQAFRDLMGQLLSESDEKLRHWKTKILEAVGENGQVLIDVIPELEQIIGQQPAVPELSGNAAQNQFNRLFQKFIQVFTTKQHPLVIFLDDLQWADSTSLNLLKLLTTKTEIKYLLILGAYRDNEVFPAHPLILALDEIQQTQTTVNTITLSPLSQDNINDLVADTLSSPPEYTQELTGFIYQKTKGNPFFTTQFFKSLYEEGCITFNPPQFPTKGESQGGWQYDITAIQQLALTDDVVEFMADQLQKLPTATQEILKLAACIGNQFELKTLAIVAEKPVIDVANNLWDALQKGLILPINQTYKLFQNNQIIEVSNPSDLTVSYKFIHDRVQQAAYSLIPQTEKATVHQIMGQLLLKQWSEQERHERVFEIVNHLNQATHLVTDPLERHQLAQLNLQAGQKAKAATAYQAALNYLEYSLNLLSENSWQQQYNFTLTIYTELANNAYFVGNYQQMEQCLTTALQQATSLLDQVPLYEIQIQAFVAQNQLQEAIQLGLTTLKKLGIDFPQQPTPEDFQQELSAINACLADRSVADLVYLPRMTEPRLLAVMRVLFRLVAVVLLGAPHLMPFIFFKMVSLSIQGGNTPFSAPGYATYGMILCSTVGDIETGYAFGQLALDILDRLPSRSVQAKTLSRFHGGVRHWKASYHSIISDLLTGYQLGLETGDLESTAIFAQVYSYTSYFSGVELSHLAEVMTDYSAAIQQLHQPSFLRWNETYRQHVLNLLGQSENPCQLIGEAYNETIDLPQQYAVKDAFGIGVAHLFKAISCYLFSNYEEAIGNLDQVTKVHRAIGSFIPGNIFYFYDALARLAQFPHLSSQEQSLYLNQIIANQQKMQKLAAAAPMNWTHKVHLVEAQYQQILGNRPEAIEKYDLAIADAKANEFIQEEALANELAAQFYLAWGKEKVAAGYMQEAYYCYARWGAKAKTKELEKRYPHFLIPILKPTSDTAESYDLTTSISTLMSMQQTASLNSTSVSHWLDFNVFTKAAQALYSEINLDKLLTVLMKMIVEISGANKAVLLLHQDGNLMVEVQYINQKLQNIQSTTLEDYQELPASLIRQVYRSQKTEIIDKVYKTYFIADPYFMQYQPQSVLCSPILNQGKVIGIVYLENSISSGAFKADRIDMLHLLCAQAAVSLENARLYRQAQQALQDLKDAQMQIVQSEKMSALGNLVAGVAHEINNPVGFLKGNIQPALDYIHDLFGLIDLYQDKLPESDPDIEAEIEAIDLGFIREDLPQLIESMDVGVERIKNISKSLRTFSRADSDRPVLFNLNEGLESTLLILKHRFKASEIRPEIKVIKNYGNLPEVECFAGQLNQVFMNILANGIDAIEQSCEGVDPETIKVNPKQITIITELLETQQQVVIRLRDNGTGMSEEVKEKIFDHLFTTKGVGKGTGLGLAIARQIVVEKHGGSLTVNSTLNQGTEFIITLPIKTAELESND